MSTDARAALVDGDDTLASATAGAVPSAAPDAAAGSVTLAPAGSAAGSGTLVCRLEDLAVGEGRAFALGDAQVAVFLTRHGDVHVIDAVCPHAGGPLADGQSDAAVVVCPLHLNVFELATGACRSGAPDVRVWPSRVVGGSVLVTSS